MLGARRDPERPADAGHPEARRAGANRKKTAELSGEDGGAEAMLRLQQQVARLHEQLRGQEARWSAALRHLQAQLDALKKQNPGPQAGRRPSEPRGPEARRSAASPQPRRHSDTPVSEATFGKMSPLAADGGIVPKRAGHRSHSVPLSERGRPPERVPSSQPISVTVEQVHSGRIVSREDGDKTVTISLRVRRAAAGTGLRSEEPPVRPGDAEAVCPPGHRLLKSRGRKSVGPAACGVQRSEGDPTARDSDARSPASRGPAGDPLARAQTAELACPSADPQVQQNLPAEAASSPHTPWAPGRGAQKERKEEARSPDGKVHAARSAGREAAASSKGAERDAGAKTTVLQVCSGDVKKVVPDQRVVRPHASARTGRPAHPGGLQAGRFPDKQTEKFHPDGSREILFPDGTVKRLSDGHEETVFPDGTSVHVDRNGDKTIVFSNGQRDIHTAQFKRREFPDGTTKTVYCNGLQETKYASGRVKVRDVTANAVRDQK